MNEIAPKNHYFNREYMRSERLLSYIDQLAVLSKFSIHSDTILEVGKGNGYFSHFIQTYFNQTVRTVDIVPELKPDYCVDISSKEFILPTTFDIGVCFEVMEHIEWERLGIVVDNLRKYVKKYLIISVPDANFFLQFKINRLLFKYIPLIVNSHFWEIGIYHSNRRITNKILISEVLGIENVLSHYRGRHFPGHHFFVLKGNAR